MRVLTLIPNQKGYAPGQRGSIELWETVLKGAGIELDYVPFESDELRRILYYGGNNLRKGYEMARSYFDRFQIFQRLAGYDAVFVYREAALIGPAILERMIAKKKPIIYQLDDPLYVPYKSKYNGYFSYLKFFGKIKEIIRISKVVIVNSSHIREYASQFNERIWQVPSVVDTSQFTYVPFPKNPGRICVGWSGSPTTVGNIKLIEKPLRDISGRNTCDFHFIGGTDFGLEGIDYTSQQWNADSEVEDLRRMQVGLVPLPENEWNKRKFIMKTAQYMALGIVPVGTPIASNPEVIRHGENGFLAANDAEWIEYITLLAADSDLRERLSIQAAIDAKEKYSLEANASKVIEAFRSALQ